MLILLFSLRTDDLDGLDSQKLALSFQDFIVDRATNESKSSCISADAPPPPHSHFSTTVVRARRHDQRA
jgi:hypothetical protein